jgi:hypothetical protein
VLRIAWAARRRKDVSVTRRDAEVISSGRDPDRAPRLPSHWRPGRRWRLAAAIVLLAGGGLTAGVLLAGQPAPHPHAGRPPAGRAPAGRAPVVHPMLHGQPPGPGGGRGAVLLLAGEELRLLSVTGRAPARLRWSGFVPGAGPLQSNSAVQIEPVTGGFVVLLASETGSAFPAVGDVFFIPATARSVAAARLIAHANYLAVAPNGRDLWVQRASPPGHLPGDTWLIDRSGRRLSSVLRLHRRILVAATDRGLLTGSAPPRGTRLRPFPASRRAAGRGGRTRLISTASGAVLPMGVPPGALIAAVSSGDVAWQHRPCRRLACPLHVTSLRTGADAVIPLPPGTQTNGQPGAFGQQDKRLALALDTIGRKHQVATTHIYIIDIGRRRSTRLPGGPLPLTQAATELGAIIAGYSFASTVSWSDGARLWIVASDSAGFQAAYWPGAGPLRVLGPQAGPARAFAVSAARAAPR